jgi:hypothetical protein
MFLVFGILACTPSNRHLACKHVSNEVKTLSSVSKRGKEAHCSSIKKQQFGKTLHQFAWVILLGMLGQAV